MTRQRIENASRLRQHKSDARREERLCSFRAALSQKRPQRFILTPAYASDEPRPIPVVRLCDKGYGARGATYYFATCISDPLRAKTDYKAEAAEAAAALAVATELPH